MSSPLEGQTDPWVQRFKWFSSLRPLYRWAILVPLVCVGSVWVLAKTPWDEAQKAARILGFEGDEASAEHGAREEKTRHEATAGSATERSVSGSTSSALATSPQTTDSDDARRSETRQTTSPPARLEEGKKTRPVQPTGEKELRQQWADTTNIS